MANTDIPDTELLNREFCGDFAVYQKATMYHLVSLSILYSSVHSTLGRKLMRNQKLFMKMLKGNKNAWWTFLLFTNDRICFYTISMFPLFSESVPLTMQQTGVWAFRVRDPDCLCIWKDLVPSAAITLDWVWTKLLLCLFVHKFEDRHYTCSHYKWVFPYPFVFISILSFVFHWNLATKNEP